jgi:hypothetical protein
MGPKLLRLCDILSQAVGCEVANCLVCCIPRFADSMLFCLLLGVLGTPAGYLFLGKVRARFIWNSIPLWWILCVLSSISESHRVISSNCTSSVYPQPQVAVMSIERVCVQTRGIGRLVSSHHVFNCIRLLRHHRCILTYLWLSCCSQCLRI